MIQQRQKHRTKHSAIETQQRQRHRLKQSTTQNTTIHPFVRTFTRIISDTLTRQKLIDDVTLSKENTQTLLDMHLIRSDIKIRTCARLFIEKAFNHEKQINESIIKNINDLIATNKLSDRYLAQIGVPIQNITQTDVRIGETAIQQSITEKIVKIIEQTVDNTEETVCNQLTWSVLGTTNTGVNKQSRACLLMSNANWEAFQLAEFDKKLNEIFKDASFTSNFAKTAPEKRLETIRKIKPDSKRIALFNLLRTMFLYRRGEETHFTPQSPFTAGAITDNFTLELQKWILLNMPPNKNTRYAGAKYNLDPHSEFMQHIASVCLYYLPWVKYTKENKSGEAKMKLKDVGNSLNALVKVAIQDDDSSEKISADTFKHVMSSLCTVCVMELEEIYYPMQRKQDEEQGELGFFSVPLVKYWSRSVQDGKDVFSHFKFDELFAHEISVTISKHNETSIKLDNKDYIVTKAGSNKTINRITKKPTNISTHIGSNPVYDRMNKQIELTRRVSHGIALMRQPAYIDEFRRTIRSIDPTCLENVPKAFLNMVDIPFTREYILDKLHLEQTPEPELTPTDDMKWLVYALIEIYK